MAATKTGTRTNQLATFLFSFYFVSSLSGTIIHTNTLNHWVHGGNTQFCVGQLMGDAVRWKEKKNFLSSGAAAHPSLSTDATRLAAGWRTRGPEATTTESARWRALPSAVQNAEKL